MNLAYGLLFVLEFALQPAYAEEGWVHAYRDCVNRHDPGCVVILDSAPLIRETPAALKTVMEVGLAVNRSMKPASDIERYHQGDYWISGQRAGDCEDSALTKRAELIARGFPANALRLAIVHLRAGSTDEVHAILLVYLSKHPHDPYVLDNRTVLFARLSIVAGSGQFNRFDSLQDEHGAWQPWKSKPRNDVLTTSSRTK